MSDAPSPGLLRIRLPTAVAAGRSLVAWRVALPSSQWTLFYESAAVAPKLSALDIAETEKMIARQTKRLQEIGFAGGKTIVESFSTVKVSVAADRIEFTWSSDKVKSSYVNAAWGRALFVRQRGPNGAETLIDYVSAVRPKNSAKGVLVESQKGVLASDARYVIDKLMAAGKQRTATDPGAPRITTDLFGCSPDQ